MVLADSHVELIDLWKAMQNGWLPPTELSEEDYQWLRLNPEAPGHLRAYAGFGCSFAGKYFGGYARCKRGDNYPQAAHNGLLSKMACMRHATFLCVDYKSLNIPDGAVVYCDPPYADTTKFNGSVAFNSGEFWPWVRELSNRCFVFVSEYKAPHDFDVVLEVKTALEMRSGGSRSTGVGVREPRVERLFIYKG